jgi:uncharacterized protein
LLNGLFAHPAWLFSVVSNLDICNGCRGQNEFFRSLLEKKSHFFLGPRQTGKSFLIAQSLKGTRVYDLLDTSIYLALSHRPQRLAEELTPKDRIVVIDEIQRLPVLLNEVHRLIEQRNIRFLLTGSSARKLLHGGVNLLGGTGQNQIPAPPHKSRIGRTL